MNKQSSPQGLIVNGVKVGKLVTCLCCFYSRMDWHSFNYPINWLEKLAWATEVSLMPWQTHVPRAGWLLCAFSLLSSAPLTLSRVSVCAGLIKRSTKNKVNASLESNFLKKSRKQAVTFRANGTGQTHPANNMSTHSVSCALVSRVEGC